MLIAMLLSACLCALILSCFNPCNLALSFNNIMSNSVPLHDGNF